MEKLVSFLEGKIDSEFIKETYKDVEAVVDAPCSFWWNIIFKHFPDAKGSHQFIEIYYLDFGIFGNSFLKF